jgi:hypothetical protein
MVDENEWESVREEMLVEFFRRHESNGGGVSQIQIIELSIWTSVDKAFIRTTPLPLVRLDVFLARILGRCDETATNGGCGSQFTIAHRIRSIGNMIENQEPANVKCVFCVSRVQRTVIG